MDEPSSPAYISPARIDAPKVSVLVPICNVERYLEECLDSLAAQSFTDFEVLCINDGSTDGSRAIIQSYMDADERFRVIDKPNSGYGASMNMGLANAIGEYIAILESDDFFEPNALELLVDAAERNQSDVVKADFYLYWSTPQERDELFRIVDEQEVGRTMRPIDDLAIFFRSPLSGRPSIARAFSGTMGSTSSRRRVRPIKTRDSTSKSGHPQRERPSSPIRFFITARTTRSHRSTRRQRSTVCATSMRP